MHSRQDLIEANRAQLRAIASSVDADFVRMHWASERALAAFVPLHARTFLDLGCGVNGGALAHVPDCSFIGLDFVLDYLTALRTRFPQESRWGYAETHWLNAGMERLPFASETFDVVYARHTLEHTPDLDAALSEIQRILRPGGRFIFCVPSRVDDTEPTHLTKWPGRKWRRAFSQVGPVRFSAHHRYFIDEFFGYAEKPGKPGLGWQNAVRRQVDFWTGQDLIPHWILRLGVSVWRRLGLK